MLTVVEPEHARSSSSITSVLPQHERSRFKPTTERSGGREVTFLEIGVVPTFV